uniref:Uncharacterized protein n=1 Tax=Knipowitschia caucasica TaxID=637954 RepID=A0AAV2JFH1_KNICA
MPQKKAGKEGTAKRPPTTPNKSEMKKVKTDISPEVGRLRASFNQVKPKLRDAGIPYSLYYPAKMTITVKGTRHVFTEPQAVEEFIRNIAPTANGDKDD